MFERTFILIDNKMDMNQPDKHRVAWLLPAMGNGGLSFQNLLCEFTKLFPETITFTGQWPGFARGFEDTFVVQEIGATRYVEFGKTRNGYTIGFSYASPQIIRHLLRFKPHVIFANSFTAWTLIALLLKPIAGWKVIITYEGGSAVYENSSSIVRYYSRRLMTRWADAFVANGQAGKSYLLDVLQVRAEKVFSKPFLVPSLKALQQYSNDDAPQIDDSLQRPLLLFVGQLIPRKGLKTLLEACYKLKQQGCTKYTLMVVGDGEQRSELEAFVKEVGLDQQVVWIGKVPYHRLGVYFKSADVFIFPTYDDIWGMVLTEAMAFGKPVICSQSAGAVEMVVESSNGYTYQPEQVDKLAKVISLFFDNPSLIKQMGESSLQIMSKYTPEDSIASFIKSLRYVWNDEEVEPLVTILE
jgi:glycosyltransferase involved in cell wall biosynthesis